MKRNFEEFKETIRGKKVGVVGLGVSNVPLMRFLVDLGAQVYGFDQREKEALSKELDAVKDHVKLHLGEDYLAHLKGMDVIFKTPGMRADLKELVEAEQAGARITSEMQEFLTYCQGKTIGVTGSDGKTTTTSVIGALLQEAGCHVYVGGNIGTPLFTKVEEIKEEDFAVLELSSFQLMTMTVSPDIAVVTNLTPNHLDVHKNMVEYMEAKKNILRFQGPSSLLVVNEDNEITRGFGSLGKGKVEYFSSQKEMEDAHFQGGSLYLRYERLVDLKEMKVKGVHNAENFLAAFLAVEEFVPKKIMRDVALKFSGVKHRCQFIREVDGVAYYNDSIASSPTRTLASISAMEKKVKVILGGYDKHLDFMPLTLKAKDYIQEAVVVGATKEKLLRAFEEAEKITGVKVSVHAVDTFEEAVDKLREISHPGDVAILSPACASFDFFKNFEARGDRFVELVKEF